MKARNEIVLEFVGEDRVYRMSMPNDAPLAEAYAATGAFMDEIIRLIKDHAEKRPSIEQAEKPDSEEK